MLKKELEKQVKEQEGTNKILLDHLFVVQRTLEQWKACSKGALWICFNFTVILFALYNPTNNIIYNYITPTGMFLAWCFSVYYLFKMYKFRGKKNGKK